jgi:dimethylargininase
MQRPVHAWVRSPAESYRDCLREDAGAAIDVERARAQHAGYVAALAATGVVVEALAPDEASPDGCFVEDTAVLWDGGGVLTSMRAPSRRGEGASVSAAIAGLAPMEGHLDGGDVLRAGARFFVGRSSRTTDAGIAALGRASGLEVVPVDVRAGLHLKSAITLLDARTAIVHGDAVDRAPFAGLELVETDEPYGANVLALGRTVLVSAAAPRTAALVRARGLHTVVLDVSELHKGDGALTCLSLRRPPPGGWCA